MRLLFPLLFLLATPALAAGGEPAPADAPTAAAPAPAAPAAPAPLPVETSWLTVASIGITTYFLAAMIHEGLGHGGTCLLVGGGVDALATSIANCRPAEGQTLGLLQRRAIAAGGVTAQFLVSGAALSLLWADPPKSGTTYYAQWLLGAVNLLQGAGYLMVGPWLQGNDWGPDGVLQGANPQLPWQIGVSVLGLGLTLASVFLLNRLLEPLVGSVPEQRMPRRRVLAWLPYLAGSAAIVLGSVFNRLGPDRATGIVSAAVSTFAGTLFMAYLPLFFNADFFRLGPKSDEPALPIPHSTPWLIAGATSLVLALAVLGPGLGGGFPERHPLQPR